MAEERNYYLNFDISISDSENPSILGNFNIVIPARSITHAKSKLEEHLKHHLDVDIKEFKALPSEAHPVSISVGK